MSKKTKERIERMENANKLLDAIKSRGNFFEDNGRIERGDRGRLWFTNDRGHRVCLSNQGKWWRTSLSGTEKAFIEGLTEKYIMNGEKLPKKLLGPWPDWWSGGDPWGYGEEGMNEIRQAAVELGIREGKGE